MWEPFLVLVWAKGCVVYESWFEGVLAIVRVSVGYRGAWAAGFGLCEGALGGGPLCRLRTGRS